MFDPERAAIYHAANGDVNEAVWLTFLSIHFGKHSVTGWQRLRDIYSGLGTGNWTWSRVSSDPDAFVAWLAANHQSIGGAFGNHRKYETLNPKSRASTGEVVRSYVKWVGPSRSHAQRFTDLVQQGGNDPHAIFDAFYHSFKVNRFGRLGRFDFLALIGRLGLAPIEPGSTYLRAATGPKSGARLLFGDDLKANLSVRNLERWISDLDADLNIGMQPMEDSLCNWQKSPDRFIHFTG